MAQQVEFESYLVLLINREEAHYLIWRTAADPENEETVEQAPRDFFVTENRKAVAFRYYEQAMEYAANNGIEISEDEGDDDLFIIDLDDIFDELSFEPEQTEMHDEFIDAWNLFDDMLYSITKEDEHFRPDLNDLYKKLFDKGQLTVEDYENLRDVMNQGAELVEANLIYPG